MLTLVRLKGLTPFKYITSDSNSNQDHSNNGLRPPFRLPIYYGRLHKIFFQKSSIYFGRAALLVILSTTYSGIIAQPIPVAENQSNFTSKEPFYSLKPKMGIMDTTKMVMGDEMSGSAGLIPQGIMVGKANRWMVGYQFSLDKMNGNLAGTERISNESILKQFMSTPTDMTMQMHMATVMYAPADKLSLMLMVPFIRKSMNHIMRDGTSFNELTSGIGDIELRALYTLYADKTLRNRLLLNTGISLPTGSINRQMGGMRLEYPMQIGSGIVAILPGFTYLGQSRPWGWGANINRTIQLGTNSNGYRLGDRYQAEIWGARQLTSWLSLSAQLNAEEFLNVRKSDPALDPMDEPTKDPGLQGGRRIALTGGLNLHPSKGLLKGNEFFLD